MFAALSGHSTLGIPKSVAEKFVGSAHDDTTIHPDMQHEGAGYCFMTPDGYVLFLRRGRDANHAGQWDFPGGHTEDDETPEETADRECTEEIGDFPRGKRSLLVQDVDKDEKVSTCFLNRVDKPFAPKLNGEHDAYAWRRPVNAPEPQHKVVQLALPKLIARAAPFRALDAVNWEEGAHPRDEDGKFAETAGA